MTDKFGFDDDYMRRTVTLKEIATYSKGSQINGDDLIEDGVYDYLNGGINPSGKWNEYNVLGNTITISEGGNSCGYVNYMSNPFWCGAHCYYLYDLKCKPKYLYYALKGHQSDIMRLRSGACMPNIKKKDLGDYSFLFETDEYEQNRIIKIFDKLSSIITHRKQQLAKLDELIKARFVEMFGDPVENPLQWDTMALENACQSIVDCPHSTPTYTFEDTGYMCIRTSIVKKNLILWDKIEYIPKDEYEQRIKRRKPQKGDIIYTREGAILGIAAIIDRNCNVALGQRSMLLSPDTKICLPEFISNAMNFDSFLNRVTEGISGSASPHINVADIRAFNIMMPPLDLQEKFANFVQQTDKSKFLNENIIQLLRRVKLYDQF